MFLEERIHLFPNAECVNASHFPDDNSRLMKNTPHPSHAGLRRLLRRLTNRGHPSHHHHLSPHRWQTVFVPKWLWMRAAVQVE